MELLGNTWVEVGWNLQTIETPADVPSALRAWEPEHRPYILLEILLMRPTESPEMVWPSDCRAFGKKLDAMYRGLDEVGESIRHVADFQQRSHDSLDQANLAVNQALMLLLVKDQPQKNQQTFAEERANLVAEEQAKRKRTFELAKDTSLWLNRYRRELEQTLKDGYAYFARAELIRFRNSHRRRLNPWAIANAIAGLPFIGYRQSLKRCSKFNREKIAGLRYEIFQTVRRILKSRPLSIGLTAHAETWLRNRRASESLAISELQQKWYYLEPSIQAVSGTKIQEAQAYEVCREYFRRIATRSPADALLEADRRIAPVVKSKKVRS